MYVFRRLAVSLFASSRRSKLAPGEADVTVTYATPWDMDMFAEMNNGRVLSVYDVGRFALAVRGGLIGAIRRRGWIITVAGSNAQYRRRIRMFQRIEIRSRVLGRDDRFFYLEQSMFTKAGPASNIIYRTAVTDRNGLVPIDDVVAEMGFPDWNPPLPDWVAKWAEADKLRPWPPAEMV
ncbi:MAG: thioesterase family protein [Pseudomonadota bacterium]